MSHCYIITFSFATRKISHMVSDLFFRCYFLCIDMFKLNWSSRFSKFSLILLFPCYSASMCYSG
uniref:Uncharacterized protein n=1 Tax=Arundo donax TaxID=35708 RepID=A0A0A8Z7Q7_ARUDO